MTNAVALYRHFFNSNFNGSSTAHAVSHMHTKAAMTLNQHGQYMLCMWCIVHSAILSPFRLPHI